jgi:hypothetical protein
MLKRNISTTKGVKKTPVKGIPEKKEIATVCSSCGKTKKIANKTRRLCTTCMVKEKKEKQKIKREVKRKIKQETITQSRLDQITSWLVRGAHKHECHACGTILDPRALQCAHFVGRTKQSTRYHLKNLLPACSRCNLYTPHHVWNLGKSLNVIWGTDTTEDMLALSNKVLKVSNYDRKLIFDVYRTTLNKIEGGALTQEEKYELLKYAVSEYERIVNPLLK